MSWKELQPGVFRRPAGENEIMIKTIGDFGKPYGRQHWAITVTAKLAMVGLASSSASEAAVRRAWMSCRIMHPGIASVFLNGDTLQYVVPDEHSMQQWADESFFCVVSALPAESDVKEEGQLDTLLQQLDPTGIAVDSIGSATLHYLKQTGHVVLRMAHWRTDGHGAVQILNDLVSLIAAEMAPEAKQRAVQWGHETSRLPPSVEVALLNPPSPPPAPLANEARRCLETTLLAKDAMCLHFRGDPSTPPGGTRCVGRRLSRTVTDTIVQACARAGVCVTAAVHAAIACTAAQNRCDGDEGLFVSTIRASLRPAVSASLADLPVQAAGLYTAGWLVGVSASASWAEHVVFFQQQYGGRLTQDFLLSRREYATQMLGRMRPAHAQDDARSPRQPHAMAPAVPDHSTRATLRLLTHRGTLACSSKAFHLALRL
ncbi:hypothetical protein KVR01_000272 [Diaporthe batatas]|uniref:uncharacterized protein n=1 Tax=Diaporthe batatas TaxID=748121 RepID=UPI001D03C07D|nr:uncharacterized protein KVR01_000272 [Diaporthe batatas]KAG8169527.1 hypothetical protein KVR01_000272 [Diaporthe batatas]